VKEDGGRFKKKKTSFKIRHQANGDKGARADIFLLMGGTRKKNPRGPGGGAAPQWGQCGGAPKWVGPGWGWGLAGGLFEHLCFHLLFTQDILFFFFPETGGPSGIFMGGGRGVHLGGERWGAMFAFISATGWVGPKTPDAFYRGLLGLGGTVLE